MGLEELRHRFSGRALWAFRLAQPGWILPLFQGLAWPGLHPQVLAESKSQTPAPEDRGAFWPAGSWVHFLPRDTVFRRAWHIGLNSGHVPPVMAWPSSPPSWQEHAPRAWLGQVAQDWCRGPRVAPVRERAGPARSELGATSFCLFELNIN